MGILDSIVEWLATQLMNLLDLVSNGILGALGCDMATFVRYFPAAETLYSVFVAIGVGVLLLNLVWQLFRNYALVTGIGANDPIKTTLRSLLFLFLTFYADDILSIVLKIAGTPYHWILSKNLPNISFGDFFNGLTVIVGVLASGSVTLIVLILTVIIAWNYIKLLFEAAERYVMVGVLVYTAPLAFAMGGSESTGSIFSSWCRMLGGQLVLLVMNAWCLRLFVTMVGTFIANPLGT